MRLFMPHRKAGRNLQCQVHIAYKSIKKITIIPFAPPKSSPRAVIPARLRHPSGAGRSIAPLLSIYLDLVRFLAAIVVVLFHTWQEFYPASRIRWPGHEAVVVFFVLSGYVIAHSTSRPGVKFADYLKHRIARIVPVAWVALFLGLSISVAKGEFPITPTLVNLFFLGQSGMWAVEAPNNPAFWSLNYEVWYYLIFAAWVFSPHKHRIVFTAIATLIAGPKALLLFPIWLMGVWLYNNTPRFSQSTALMLLLWSLAAAGALYWFNISDFLRDRLYQAFPPAWRFHYSSQFIYDFLLGIIVSIHFAAVASLDQKTGHLARIEKPIRYLAGFTLSIYLFHSPLNVLNRPGISALQFYTELAVCIFLLAQLTERRIKFFRKLLDRKRPVHVTSA